MFFSISFPGPLLLPNEIEKTPETPHDGISFELPGPTLIRLAPLLYVLSKLLLLAGTLGQTVSSAVAPGSGSIFPTNIPGLGNILKNTNKIKKLTKGYERISALGDTLETAKNMVDLLVERLQVNETMETKENADQTAATLKSIRDTMRDSYGAMHTLLTSPDNAKEAWDAFKASSQMSKVYEKNNSRIRWVRTKHVDKLLKSNRFLSDQRHSVNQYNNDDDEEEEDEEKVPALPPRGRSSSCTAGTPASGWSLPTRT